MQMAAMYLEGHGVKQNDRQTLKWLRKAARQDYGPAQALLGFLYEQGRAVRPDAEQARLWYGKAAA